MHFLSNDQWIRLIQHADATTCKLGVCSTYSDAFDIQFLKRQHILKIHSEGKVRFSHAIVDVYMHAASIRAFAEAAHSPFRVCSCALHRSIRMDPWLWTERERENFTSVFPARLG